MRKAEDVLRTFLDEVWNAHRIDRFGDHVHPDVRFHPPRGPPRDFAQYREMAAELMRAFPDIRFTVERAWGAGDLACARLVLVGTNEGPFRGRPATGRSVKVIGQPQCRVQEGRIVEFWQLFDELGTLHQLGHVADEGLLGPSATRPQAP